MTTSIVAPLAGAGMLTVHQVYPYSLAANPPLRRVPIRRSEALAEGALRSRLIPVLHGLGVYILVPLLLILLVGEAG